jgi:hypothetical protein
MVSSFLPRSTAARPGMGEHVTFDEFKILWHDWLRGVSLVVLIAVLAVLYVLKVMPEPAFALLVTALALAIGIGMVGLRCLVQPAPLFVRAASLLLAVAGAAVVVLTLAQQIYPGDPVARAAISHLQPHAVLPIPAAANLEAYLMVKGNPGASPSGTDRQVIADLRLRIGESLQTIRADLFSSKGGQQGSAKGLSLSRKDSDLFLLSGTSYGELTADLTSLRPDTALPFQLALFVPPCPPSLLRLAALGLFGLSLLLAIFLVRGGAFPLVMPLLAAFAVAQLFFARGVSPTQPALPAVGMIVGAAVLGSTAGWLAAWALHKTAAALRRTPLPSEKAAARRRKRQG